MGQVVFSSTYHTSQTGTMTCNLRVTYSETYNEQTNQTTVKVTGVEIQKVGNSTNWGSMTLRGSIQIGGSTLVDFGLGSASVTVSLSGSGYCSVSGFSSSTVTITHNADGSASTTAGVTGRGVPISGVYYCGAAYNSSVMFGAATQSTTINLTTRPRISSVSATDAYIGEPVMITLSRFNSDFTHTVTVSCAGHSETLMTKGITYPTLTWTPALATYAPRITNAMAATATITCETYNGDTLIGQSTTTCTLTLKAADVAPVLAITTADPTGNLATYGKYVKSKSKITVTLTPTMAYGATLATQSIIANGATYNTSPATTDFILSVNSTGISATITDSRGQTATATATIQIYEYAPPKINAFEAHRCDNDGTPNNAGAYFAADYDIELSPLGNQNSRTLKARYKKLSASTYSEETIVLSGYTEVGTSQPIAVDTNSTYNVELYLADDFGNATVALILPTASTRMNFGAGENGGVAIGKVSEYNKTLEIADDWDVKLGGDTHIGGDLSLDNPLTISSGGIGADNAADARANLGIKGTLYFKNKAVLAGTGTICTISDAAIDEDYVVSSMEFSSPKNITSGGTWSTASGTLTITGTCSAATTVSVVLVPKYS